VLGIKIELVEGTKPVGVGKSWCCHEVDRREKQANTNSREQPDKHENENVLKQIHVNARKGSEKSTYVLHV